MTTGGHHLGCLLCIIQKKKKQIQQLALQFPCKRKKSVETTTRRILLEAGNYASCDIAFKESEGCRFDSTKGDKYTILLSNVHFSFFSHHSFIAISEQSVS